MWTRTRLRSRRTDTPLTSVYSYTRLLGGAVGGAKTYLSCLFFFLLCFSSHSFSFVLFIFFHFFFIQFFPFSCSFIFSFRALNSVSFSSIYSRLYFLYRSFSLVTSFHSVPFWVFFFSLIYSFFFISFVLFFIFLLPHNSLFCLFVCLYPLTTSCSLCSYKSCGLRFLCILKD